MKVMIYSPPFKGHLNVLRKMMQKHTEMDYRLVITGWDNLPVPEAINLAKSTLRETDPALWTFPRLDELLGESIEVAREYKPDLILYDFFSLEGYFTGKLLGIPYWCSIPAMVGPNNNKEYLDGKVRAEANRQALARLKDQYHIDASGVEMISDGFHFPGEVNLIWSYSELTPENFREGRKQATYYFVGNENQQRKREKDTIYFSLGSVVMGNLWNQQVDVRDALKTYVSSIAEGIKGEKVMFVTQGQHVLDRYPENWQIEENVDQIEALARAKAFITHGGSNSFHEAVLQKVPLVVVPFFGDQILVGQQVERLGIGITLAADNSIDTKKSKAFLNGKIAQQTVAAVAEVLRNPEYQRRADNLRLTKDNISEILGKYFPRA